MNERMKEILTQKFGSEFATKYEEMSKKRQVTSREEVKNMIITEIKNNGTFAKKTFATSNNRSIDIILGYVDETGTVREAKGNMYYPFRVGQGFMSVGVSNDKNIKLEIGNAYFIAGRLISNEYNGKTYRTLYADHIFELDEISAAIHEW